jgi:hypothetical protein
MWNHNMRYQSPSYVANFRNMMVDAAGGTDMQGELDIWQEYPTFYPGNSAVLSPTDPYWMVHVDWTGPARKRIDPATSMARHSWVNSSTMLSWHQARDCGSMNRPRETEDARPALSY